MTGRFASLYKRVVAVVHIVEAKATTTFLKLQLATLILMKQDWTSSIEPSPFIFLFCFRIVILWLCGGEEYGKPKLSADQTSPKSAPDVAQQFWATLIRVMLSIDKTVSGNVTGSVDRDLDESFTSKKKL